MKIIYLLLCLVILFISGCGVDCEVPFTEYEGGCCIDRNMDGSCDKLEAPPYKQPQRQNVLIIEKESPEHEIKEQVIEEKEVVVEDIEETEEAMEFIPDSGMRTTSGGIPKASLVNGVVYLYYDDSGEKVATSNNGLDFTAGTLPVNYEYDARNILLPDGNWRRYWLEIDGSGVFEGYASLYSTDGKTFTAETGYRYEVQDIDNDWLGYTDIFTNSKDEVVMLYIGDGQGLNNIRMAISFDNGENFEFVEDDVLDDAQYGGGSNSYVDPYSIETADGRLMFVMKQGTIYWFSSDKEGKEWTKEPGSLSPEDFTEFDIGTLHDPGVIILEDGSYRMYLGVTMEDGSTGVVSALYTP